MAASKGEAIINAIRTLVGAITTPSFVNVHRLPPEESLTNLAIPAAWIWMHKSDPQVGMADNKKRWGFTVGMAFADSALGDGDVTATADRLREAVENKLGTTASLSGTCTNFVTTEWQYDYPAGGPSGRLMRAGTFLTAWNNTTSRTAN